MFVIPSKQILSIVALLSCLISDDCAKAVPNIDRDMDMDVDTNVVQSKTAKHGTRNLRIDRDGNPRNPRNPRNPHNHHNHRKHNKRNGGSERIIGGTDANSGDYPWFARGTRGSSWWGCGGALVTSEFVLTAAHCGFDTSAGFQIGALCDPYGPSDSQNCGQKVESLNSQQVFQHPLYNGASSISYDFTLVKLDSSSTIDPVPLDEGTLSTSYTGGEPLWAIGVGNDVGTATGPAYYPDHLQHVEIDYIPTESCVLSIDDTMMCAADPDQGACFGDSGGPLYDKINDKLVGVVSWGTFPCAENPTVFSRIANQWEAWIKPTICDNHSSPKPDFCSSAPPPPPSPTPPASECADTEDHFELELLTDTYGEDITWQLRKESSRGRFRNYLKGGYDTEYGDNTLYKEEYCIPKDSCYRFIINDVYGDGLCCQYGEGYYKISLNGSEVKKSDFEDKFRDRIKFGSC